MRRMFLAAAVLATLSSGAIAATSQPDARRVMARPSSLQSSGRSADLTLDLRSTGRTDPAFAAALADIQAGDTDPSVSLAIDGQRFAPPTTADTWASGLSGAPETTLAGPKSQARSRSGWVLAGDQFRRFGGLPEPTTWALLLIGFCMIGAALRGLIVANRRLASLRAADDQPSA